MILVSCFTAVVTCFVVSAFYSDGVMRKVDVSLDEISEDVLPRIEHLRGVRRDLRDVDQVLSEGAEGHPWAHRALERTLSAIEVETVAYVEAGKRSGTPDGTLHEETARALDEVRRLAENTRDDLIRNDRSSAESVLRNDLRPAIRRAEDGLRALLDSCTHEASAAVHAAEVTRRHATLVALGLDALSVLVSLAVGMLALRATNQAELVVANRVDELEQFATRLAHDIRGPLMPALFALQEGTVSMSVGPEMRPIMERGLRSLRIVESIAEGLFEFARSGARPEPGARASVREVVEGVVAEVEAMAAAKGTEVCVEPFEDCEASCAPGVLASILSNLVRNGIRYVGDRPRREVRVSVHDHEAVLRVEVEDTGPGLPTGLETTVFEPYVRGQSGTPGLGLGLATVKRLTEAYGGTVGVVSRAGEGCTFWFELPRALGDEAPSTAFARV